MQKKIPPYIKAMQNGALGEIRTKAFLMERFWILERSIDVDGADFIIQRRLSSKTLLDKRPPRLGFVQAKFYLSSATTQYIPESYIVDEHGNSRDEFFLLCHTGHEENAKIFFLTAKLIISDFNTIIQSGIRKYAISGTRLFTSSKYLIQSKSNTLNRIESQLRLADYISNQEFISWNLSTDFTASSAIQTEFMEPIETSFGADIPKEFQRLKNNAFEIMSRIEEWHDTLQSIVREVDPIQASLSIRKLELDEDFKKLSRTSLYDDNFYFSCKSHLNMVNTLDADGILDNFIKLKKIIKGSVVKFLLNQLPLDENVLHVISITLDMESLEITSFQNSIISIEEYCENKNISKDNNGNFPYKGVHRPSCDSLEYFWKAGKILFSSNSLRDLKDFYANEDFYIYNDIVNKIYELKYHE